MAVGAASLLVRTYIQRHASLDTLWLIADSSSYVQRFSRVCSKLFATGLIDPILNDISFASEFIQGYRSRDDSSRLIDSKRLADFTDRRKDFPVYRIPLQFRPYMID